uniref:EGF-like domain-containing protein n=1 Tax=Ciona intestinalis TaxID=7719 RepID=F6QH31_CIOIN
MFLKLFLVGFCLLSYSTDVYGQAISCYSCLASTFNAASSTSTNNCFNSVANGFTSLPCTLGFYCRSQFNITDGVVTSIERRCTDPANDHDAFTTSVPPATQCTAFLANNGTNPVDTTTCYHSCNSNNCNTISTSGLQTCMVNCTNGGVCDYFSRSCVCRPGFSGTDCSTSTTPTYISCIQCNGLTDTGCESATSATQCPLSTAAGQKYCYTSKIETYDRVGARKGTVVVRGCTRTPQRQDECTFTSPFDPQLRSAGFTERTCTNTCEGSNCNTVIPDGKHTAARNIYCVQCEDVNLNSASPASACATNVARTQCPTGSTHCISTVEYYISDRVDRSYTYGVQGTSPGYELRSVVRGCASTPVTAACTSESVGLLNAKKVTCTETCQTDGCNTGWPARPICTQCSSDFAQT